MSYWTYVNGTITVSAVGRTQPEMRYIIETVLAHLPKVTGSEQDMKVYVIQKDGNNGFCTHDEFGIWQGVYNRIHTQDKYILVLDGSLRDRMFEDTFAELNNFLNRLAKRLDIDDILVSLKAYDKEYIFKNQKAYADMYEWPSWSNKTGEPAWWEYLMWDRGIDTELPMGLEYKYVNNPKNDAEWERRQKVMKEEL